MTCGDIFRIIIALFILPLGVFTQVGLTQPFNLVINYERYFLFSLPMSIQVMILIGLTGQSKDHPCCAFALYPASKIKSVYAFEPRIYS